MNAACERCRGACCESLVVSKLATGFFDLQWLKARGKLLDNGAIELPSRCPKLDDQGRCSIYQERPFACDAYPVGGSSCRAAVIRRRPPAEADAILQLIQG